MWKAGRLLVVWVLVSLTPAASAHIVTEAPWHPLAYAYRSAVFLINLRPTDWTLVERAFTASPGPGAPGASARQQLLELDAATGSAHWPAIEHAMAAQDRDALYGAATRAVSQAIRYHLAQAAEQLDRPGAATHELEQARALYRSFADFIQEADPSGFRDVGLAWLDLASSVGHAGVVKIGAEPADEVAFAAARGVIGSYLITNYEPDAHASRTTYAPIPEQRLEAYPVAKPWLPPGSDLNDQDPLPRLVLNFEQQGIDERGLFLVAFGDMLFELAADLRRAGAQSRHRLLDLPQSRRHQSALLHPGDQPAAGLGRRRRQLLQRPFQRLPQRCARHSEPARHPVHGPLWS